MQSRRFNTGTDIFGDDVQRSKSTVLINKTGYFTTIEVLRAALHSKESWETAVYYQHTNLNATETGQLLVSQRTFFDAVGRLGGSSGESPIVQSAIAQQLGVYKPSYNRQTGNPFITNLSTSIEVNEFREALKDACFEATKKAAEKYYGKAFIVRLPYDKNYDDDWRIFARSASDAKGPINSFLIALDIIAEKGIEPDYNIKVIMDMEEEMGSPNLPPAVKKFRKK